MPGLRLLWCGIRWPPIEASAAGDRSLQLILALLMLAEGRPLPLPFPFPQRKDAHSTIHRLDNATAEHTPVGGRHTELLSGRWCEELQANQGRGPSNFHEVHLCANSSAATSEAYLVAKRLQQMTRKHCLLPIALQLQTLSPDDAVQADVNARPNPNGSVESIRFRPQWTPEEQEHVADASGEEYRGPDVVIHDTFIAEDMYGWRVRRAFQKSHHRVGRCYLEILDTQDIHSLRQARQQIVSKHVHPGALAADFKISQLSPNHTPASLLELQPGANRFSLDSQLMKSVKEAGHRLGIRPQGTLGLKSWARELAAMIRCDASLVISPFEYQLLAGGEGDSPGILAEVAPAASERLITVPFLPEKRSEVGPMRSREFSHRKHALSIGTFRHAPNCDSVLVLKTLWRKVFDRLLQSGDLRSSCHVFGSKMSHDWKVLHEVDLRFYMKGYLADIGNLSNYRVLLAPLRFGAGLKGKLIAAIAAGTPVVTTSIGAEGYPEAVVKACMCIADSDEEFSEMTMKIMTDPTWWAQMHKGCLEAMTELRRMAADSVHHLDKHLSQIVRSGNNSLTDLLLSDDSRMYMAKCRMMRLLVKEQKVQ